MSRTSFSIQEIFTGDQLRHMRLLYRQLAGTGRFAKECAAQYVQPNLPHIEKVLGQEMDAMFVAYAVEYTFSQSE